MTNVLLFLAIFVWPFGQLLLLSGFDSSLRLQLLDVISVLLFLSLTISKESRQKTSQDPLFRPILFFAATAILSLLLTARSFLGGQHLSALLYLLRFVSYTSFYFAFRREGFKKYSRYFIFSAVLFLAIGFLQYIFLPDTRYLRYLGFDDHYYRLIGSFLDPNFTGLVLASLTLLSPWPILLIPLLALVLTFSRASFLALAAGLLYIYTAKRQFRLLLLLLLLSLFLYLVPKPFGEGINLLRTFSIISRLENQKQALRLFVKSPLFGVGFNTLKSSSASDIPNLSSGVDNSFLFVLATMGLVGFSAFMYLLKTAWGLTKNLAARGALVAILVHSLVNNSFFYSWILVIFFLLVNLPAKKSV